MLFSNADEVVVWIGQFADTFNFSRPGPDQSLGRDVAMAVIRGPEVGQLGGIMGRCVDQTTPNGTPWPENSDNPSGHGYRSQKMKKYGWDETNRRTGQMLSQQSLYGRTTIESDLITLIYGEDATPSASVSPTGYISEQDKATTDSDKAKWAHEQKREFYGLGEGDPENVSRVCQASLNEMIREANRGRT